MRMYLPFFAAAIGLTGCGGKVQSSGPVIGAGTLKCSEWTQARATYDSSRDSVLLVGVATSLLTGNVSGRSRGMEHEDLSIETLQKRLDAECRKTPLATIAEGADSLIHELDMDRQ
jgi:hypothetical protein